MTNGALNVGGKLPRELVLRFHTSSIEKFLQARIIFERHNLTLRYFRESQEPYREEYQLGQRVLLERALHEIKTRFDANSLFFVEDTSARIAALSSNGDVFPGLRVKEWFRETSFASLDTQLKSHGNNRAATVYSDIALYVPQLDRTVFIHGETSGHIATASPEFQMSYQSPWLTPRTFNGWFVPDGCDKTLGEMEFEESLDHDFRVKSLHTLVDRLEEYSAILNLPTRSYFIPKPNIPEQEWLFPRVAPLSW